jgi:hypothetical protein
LKIKKLSDKRKCDHDGICGMSVIVKITKDTDPEDILKEEFLQEKAAVLGRAGEKVYTALENLRGIEKIIEDLSESFNQIVEKCRAPYDDNNLMFLRKQALKELNAEISRFNRVREYAKLRYYYLVVTREAMGMRRHHWIEDVYRIPPKKTLIQDE